MKLVGVPLPLFTNSAQFNSKLGDITYIHFLIQEYSNMRISSLLFPEGEYPNLNQYEFHSNFQDWTLLVGFQFLNLEFVECLISLLLLAVFELPQFCGEYLHLCCCSSHKNSDNKNNE